MVVWTRIGAETGGLPFYGSKTVEQAYGMVLAGKPMFTVMCKPASEKS